MKARRTAAALLAATLVGATGAQAQMMGPGGGGMGGSVGFFSNALARGPFMMAPFDMRDVAAAWLNGQHATLSVTPDQEAAWLAFANAVNDQAADMQAFRTQMLQSSTAPQRASLAEQFMAQRHESAAAVSAALSALYAVLTPVQRAVLDQAYAAACSPGGLFGG